MKYDKFFLTASEKGITDSQLIIATHYTMRVEVFEGQVLEYQVADGTSVTAKGIYRGKAGTVSLDHWSNSLIDEVTDEIIENASIIQNDDPVFIYEGSEKYHKFNVYDKTLETIDPSVKINLLIRLNDKIKDADLRVNRVEVSYSETSESYTIINSKGLKLSQKANYFMLYAGAYVKERDVVKTGSDYIISNKFSDIDIDTLAANCVHDGLSKLGGTTCETKKYKAILKQDVVAELLSVYLDHASSENIQKGTSMWADKKGKEVASKKLSVIDQPLKHNVFGRYFDDEGVACYDKPIIKYGILSNYLYNLTTAAKDGVTSTGNGFGRGSKTGISTAFISVRPGRRTLDELAERVGDGVYITEVEGFQGINQQNGDFSLQSTGFLIKNGKISQPLDLITISGNLFELFKDVCEVGSDLKLTDSGCETPSLVVKKLLVASKED
ncbi:MAG: TldD/PmbA family protein [Coprobacillus sp.]|nr:TldD/PmbA family protein [Coprobacillus sp.]